MSGLLCEKTDINTSLTPNRNKILLIKIKYYNTIIVTFLNCIAFYGVAFLYE